MNKSEILNSHAEAIIKDLQLEDSIEFQELYYLIYMDPLDYNKPEYQDCIGFTIGDDNLEENEIYTEPLTGKSFIVKYVDNSNFYAVIKEHDT